MLKKTEFLILFIFLAIVSCEFHLPTGTGLSDEPSNSNSNEIKSNWSPYVGVFPGINDIQESHLLKLINAGMLKGVRLGWLHLREAQNLAGWIQNQGVDVLGLFENEFLRRPDICQIFSKHVRENPGIVNWEIGNEVNYINMSPKEYVEIVTRLFFYVKQNHPEITLVSGGIGGNVAAADSLRQMIDAGLDKLCRDGLEVVAIHFYSWESFTRIAEFKSQIARLPAHVRTFITETNTMPPDWNKQIGYVEEVYPQLRNSLKAERIYWFAFCGQGDFSLVMENTWEYSPLMNLLIGAINDDQSVSTSASGLFEESYNGLFEPPRLRTPGYNKDIRTKHEKRERQ